MDHQSVIVEWNKNKWESKNKGMYEVSNGQNQWPWFYDDVDPDIEKYLYDNTLGGESILDIGTCSGGQAIGLAKKGFDVTGTDISTTALQDAKDRAAKIDPPLNLRFEYDDIIDSKLADNTYDLVFDRGCFHCICYFGDKEYIGHVSRILKPGGKLLLKAMSAKETRFVDFNRFGDVKVPMPAHFTEELITKVFSPAFEIESISDSFFYSKNIDPPAKAIFAVLKAKA